MHALVYMHITRLLIHVAGIIKKKDSIFLSHPEGRAHAAGLARVTKQGKQAFTQQMDMHIYTSHVYIDAQACRRNFVMRKTMFQEPEASVILTMILVVTVTVPMTHIKIVTVTVTPI